MQYNTVANHKVKAFMEDKRLNLSIANIGALIIEDERVLPPKEFYNMRFPALMLSIHLADPDRPTDKKAILTINPTFSSFPKTLPNGKAIVMGRLTTNNPVIIDCIESMRTNEKMTAGKASIMNVEEMLDECNKFTDKTVEKAVKLATADTQAAMEKVKGHNDALVEELARMRGEIEKLKAASAPKQAVVEAPKPKPAVVEETDEKDTDAAIEQLKAQKKAAGK